MSLLVFVVGSAIVLATAYWIYGSLLSRLLQLDDRRPTPAVACRDDVDFEPTAASFLMGQHFSAIAAAGPIVGPILAGLAFGWLPALIWILLGSILIGGVHDMTSLVASIRHPMSAVEPICCFSPLSGSRWFTSSSPSRISRLARSSACSDWKMVSKCLVRGSP